MNQFSEDLGWILTNFKSERINFAEADQEIRQLIGRQFGMSLTTEKISKAMDWIQKFHHHDGCSHRYGSYKQEEPCDCGKLEILK